MYDDYYDDDDEPFTYDDIIEPYDPYFDAFAGDEDPEVGCLYDVRKDNLLYILMDGFKYANGEVPHIHIGTRPRNRIASCTLGSGNIRGNLTSREQSMLDIWLHYFSDEATELYQNVTRMNDDDLYSSYQSGCGNYMGLQFKKRQDYERIYEHPR